MKGLWGVWWERQAVAGESEAGVPAQGSHSMTGDHGHRRMVTLWLVFSFYIQVSLL